MYFQKFFLDESREYIQTAGQSVIWKMVLVTREKVEELDTQLLQLPEQIERLIAKLDNPETTSVFNKR